MDQPIRTAATLIRRLPTHELNARRTRKQLITRLPALATAPASTTPSPTHHQPKNHLKPF